MSTAPRSCSQRAFTLIELLVVVAMIAVLIGILVPSLARARQQAYQVKCAAHLRGIGQGIFYYALDSSNGNGYLPQLGVQSHLYPGAYWPTQILPYVKIKRSKVGSRDAFLRCPTDEAPTYRFITGPRAGQAATVSDKQLADTGRPGDPSGSGTRRRGGSPSVAPPAAAQGLGPMIEPVSYAGSDDTLQAVMWPGQGAESPRKISEIRRPHCQVLVTEDFNHAHENGAFGWGHFNPVTATRRHYGGTNWLFADGHVQWHHVESALKQVLCCQDFGAIPGSMAREALAKQERVCAGAVPPNPSTRRR